MMNHPENQPLFCSLHHCGPLSENDRFGVQRATRTLLLMGDSQGSRSRNLAANPSCHRIQN